MQERSKRLLQQAVDYWTFIETDFRPPEVVRPTEPLGDDTSFRGSVVTAYEYGDVSETVTDWAHLTPKVISILLEQNRAKLLEFANTEALLTTSPAERESERGMRMVDPSLGVFVNNNTDSKIGLFRRVFEALDLDTEELVFTLRPPSTDSEKVFPAEPVVQRESTYSALTKFLDAVTEASVLKPSIEFTADLRDEFSSEFRPFHRESWLHDLNGQALAQFTAATPVAEMTAEQVLAVISGLFSSEAMFGAGAVHQSIIDGSMKDYLVRLDALG